MADVNAIHKMLDQIEHQLRFHGMWLNPYIPPPKIQIQDTWDDTTRKAAQALNRIFHIRSIPDCARLFGPVRETMVDAFFHDYHTSAERVDYARNQLNLLVAELGMLPRIDTSIFSRIED